MTMKTIRSPMLVRIERFYFWRGVISVVIDTIGLVAFIGILFLLLWR